ncbi:hypothetical protein KR018_001044 [Drosophila ironensis]|nr:hypothetical protein KR018_001044 [Drosophila ironensis]
MSSGFSFWNGQPVTSPVFPQMGDLMSPNSSGYNTTTQWPASIPSGSGMQMPMSRPQSPYPSGFTLSMGSGPMMNMQPGMDLGMGDFRMSNSSMGYYGQPHSQFQPCLENGEAFCAYNGLDMDSPGAKGDFW